MNDDDEKRHLDFNATTKNQYYRCFIALDLSGIRKKKWVRHKYCPGRG
jgi:hypothetical protein